MHQGFRRQKRHEENIGLTKEEISQGEKHFRMRFEEEQKVFKRKTIEAEASFRKACLAELHGLFSDNRSDRYMPPLFKQSIGTPSADTRLDTVEPFHVESEIPHSL